MFRLSIFVSIVIFTFIHRNGLTLRVHELQFLGCFREGLDTASRDLLYDVRNDFELCATYCILQDALVFGMTDDGSCACQLASYDMYDGFIKDWCRNPCQGRFTYSDDYSCGGGVIFMSYYRVCPPYTFGEHCENFCMCESSMCHGISGICSNKGCLDPTTDASNNEDYSICPTMYCDRLTGPCLTLCGSSSVRFDSLMNCTCGVGYQINALTLSCEDVNECAQPSTKDCDVCLNVPGSFECLCHPPNVIARFSERSICRPPPLFDDVCSNCTKDKVCEILDKRSKCLCPHGSIETAGERVCYHRIRCIDLIYCHICDIEVDYITCRCRPGYILADNYVCMDIDECENSRCKSCVNFPGSSLCQCPDDCMCSDPMIRPLCKSTYMTVPVNINYLGGGNFPNKAVVHYHHQDIMLGLFSDAYIKYTSTLTNHWWIEGMLNKSIVGSLLRIGPKAAKPGNFTAIVSYKIFSKRKQVKLYFTVMHYSEFFLQPSGVVAVTGIPDSHSIAVVPQLKISTWSCSYDAKSVKSIILSLIPTNSSEGSLRTSTCHITSINKTIEYMLQFETRHLDDPGALTRAKMLTINFHKKIRVNQMAYDSVTFVYKIDSTSDICVENCGLHAKVDKGIKYQISDPAPGDKYFYWRFEADELLVKFGVGLRRFEIPVELIWSLPTRRYNVYVKKTTISNPTQTEAYAHSFEPRKIDDGPNCSFNISTITKSLQDRMLKIVRIACPALADTTHYIFFGDCNETAPPNTAWVFLYGGIINPEGIALRFLTNGNVGRIYCFIDHRITGDAEFVSEKSTETSNEFSVDQLDIKNEFDKMKDDILTATALHEIESRLYSVIRAMNSDLRINHASGLIIEHDQERLKFAKFLLVDFLPKDLTRSQMFLATKIFELLTQFIEELDVREVDIYNASPYVRKFEDVLRIHGNETIKQRFCTDEDFYRIILKSLSNLVFAYIRELEYGDESTAQVSLVKFKTMIINSTKLTLDGVAKLKRDITLSMNFLKIFVLQERNRTIGDLVVLPATIQRPFKVEFRAPATQFSVEITCLVFNEMLDNEIKFKFVPLVIHLKSESGTRIDDPHNRFKIGFLLRTEEEPSFYGFLIDSARITLASSNLVSNGTSIFELEFVVQFASSQMAIHHSEINVFLCPESVAVYDDKSLEISCYRKLNSDYLFAGSGIWQNKTRVQRTEYVTNVFKVIISIENIFEAVSANISLSVNKLACLTYKESVGNWSFEGCKNVMENESFSTCDYKPADEYSAYRLSIPIDLNTDSTKDKNFFGLKLIALVWLLGVIVGLWAAISDARAEVESIPVDLGDNPLRGLYCYLVIINTGNVMNAGAFTNIFLTLIGSMNQKCICCLKNSFFPVLKRGSKNYFIMRSKTSLGHILILQMWHRGVDTISNWFVHDIKVIDLQTQSSYYFLCYSWVGVNNIEWKSSLLCIIITYEDFHKVNNLLPHNTYRYVQYKHRLLSIFLMPGIDRLSRFDRVISFTFRIIFTALVTLFTLEKGFELGLLYVNVGAVQGTVIVNALFAILYTSVMMFFVDLALLTMKWQPHPIVFAKDNILGIHRGVEITSFKVVNNVLKVMLHIVRPRDADVSVDDVEVGQKMFGNLFYLKAKYFLRQFTPGVFFIISVLCILSLLIFALSYSKSSDRIHHWKEMLFVSYVVNFVVADTVELALTVLIFSFIVKAEIHPEVVNTEKILYTVRRELADSIGLILADAIATRKKNIKYKRPMHNQFTSFTRKYRMHKIIAMSRYVDMFFALVLLFALMVFCIFGFVGPSSGVREVNSFLIRSFKEDQTRQIITKENYWNYIENVVLKQIYSNANESEKENGTDQETLEEFLLTNVTDENLTELIQANAFEDLLDSIFTLPNNITFALKAVCLKILASYKYSLVIMFDEIQPSSWRSFCFTRNKTENLKLLTEVVKKSSFHRSIKGLAFKLFLYTPEVHVFSMFTVATVNTHSGRLRTKMEVLSRKFYSFAELRQIFIFFCIFLCLTFFLIITYLLHIYYDGVYTFVIIFRLSVQTLSLVFSLLFMLSILISLQEPYEMFTSRSMFFNVSFSTLAERLKSTMYILVVFFTLLRPIMFIAHKLQLGRFYWNESFTHLHQAYTMVFIILTGHGISMLWHLKSYYRLRSLREAVLISSLTIYHAADTKRLIQQKMCYLNIVAFITTFIVVKWVIFSHFFYMKDWRRHKRQKVTPD